MTSNEDVVEICSSDDENNHNKINDDKSSNHKRLPSSSSPMASPGYYSSLVSEPDRELQITVKDSANSKKNKSTRIVIEIDEGMSSETRKARRQRASKLRLYGFEHKDEDFTEQFIELLELCLNYEFSDGMMRILHKSLIPYYKSADKNYIESVEFQKFIEGIINRISETPHRKFSALKDLCDTLKKAQPKRRVNLVTITNNISEAQKRRLTNSRSSPKRPRIVNVLDVDQLCESSVIDLDSLPTDDVILVDDEQKNCRDSNKDNPPNNNVPNETERHTMSDEQKKILDEIKTLELQIEYHKKEINFYDNMEVTNDSVQSPYILSDVHQGHVLRLYKRVCELSGQSFVQRKSKRVTLTVKEGHISGPAKKLEEWLKANAQDGDPPFPDFIDVVKCVSDAIAEDGLSWSKEKILSEARMLFTECGRALKKRRQEREYRDLVSKVKDMDVDKDPADDDPLLLRRLEENKMIANLKEAAIIEEYAKMKTHNRTKVNKKIVVLEQDPAAAENNAREANLNTTNSVPQNNNFSFEVPVTTVVNICKVSAEKDSQETEVDVKPPLVPRPIESSIEIVVSDSEDYSSSENEESDFELDDVVAEKNSLTDDREYTSSLNDFAQSIVITNVVSESAPQNIYTEANTNEIGVPNFVITNIRSEFALQAPLKANIPGQVTKINSPPTLQNDGNVPTETNSYVPTFVLANISSAHTLRTIPEDNKNIILDENTSRNSSDLLENDSVATNDSEANDLDSTIKNDTTPVIKSESNVEGISQNQDLISNCNNNIIIKTEPRPSTAEETLKMLLEFEKNSSINGICMKTTIFDLEQEPIVCIEISSSESESDSDDENRTDDDENGAVNNENGKDKTEPCGEKKDEISEDKTEPCGEKRDDIGEDKTEPCGEKKVDWSGIKNILLG